MGFTTFIDDLAFVEVLIAFVAALCAYAGFLAWWAVRENDAPALRSVLRGLAVPLGGAGAVAIAVALWGEMTWPFLASDGLGGYNIFFFDPLLLLGIVLLAYTASVFANVKLQFFGLLALIAGAVVIFYGYTGFTASPAFTKDPLDTLLMYLAFGACGVATFPVTVVVDYYLGAADAGKVPFAFGRGSSRRGSPTQRLGTRAAQPVGPAPDSVPSSSTEGASAIEYHMPTVLQVLVLLFPVVLALAAIAAFWYFGTTLPGHLGSGPAGAP